MLSKECTRVGLVYSRVRESPKPTPCFRCLEEGHDSKTSSGVDRSNKCRRCGKTDHYRKDCLASAQEAENFKELERGSPNGTTTPMQ